MAKKIKKNVPIVVTRERERERGRERERERALLGTIHHEGEVLEVLQGQGGARALVYTELQCRT